MSGPDETDHGPIEGDVSTSPLLFPETWALLASIEDVGDKREAFQGAALEAGLRVMGGEVGRAAAIDELIELAEAHVLFTGAQAREDLEHVVGRALMSIRALPIRKRAQTNGHTAAAGPHGAPTEANARSGGQPAEAARPSILSKRQFIEGFIPPDYLVDGIIQRGFLYGLTGQTGHGKSALALLIARLVGRPEGEAHLGSHAVDPGRVIYLAGENPDDLRIRIIGDDAKSGRDGKDDNIGFIPGVFGIADMWATIEAEARAGVDLVIVDTSAAYFVGTDEQANAQMGPYARMLRTLTTLPGRPAVIVLCHPIKHVVDPSQLLPRGGGAFLAELDGNLTLWKKDDAMIELWHGKMRGPGFEPMTFRLEKINTTALVDSKGRTIPTVRAVPVSEHEEETEAFHARSDEDELLVAMLESGRSVSQLAGACRWTLQNGDPHKSKVHRVMKRLADAHLVKKGRGETWQLADPGKAAATAAKTATDVHESGSRRYGN